MYKYLTYLYIDNSSLRVTKWNGAYREVFEIISSRQARTDEQYIHF